MSYRSISYWFDSLGADPVPRAPLPGDLEVDVAIVGGGFTGVWTAYYLMLADPDCRVALLEADTVGFGASGRNGGWCWASVAGLHHHFERDPEKGNALRQAIGATIDEVGAVCASEGIEADYSKGGGLTLTNNPAQAERVRAHVDSHHEIGWSEEEVRWLEPAEVREHMRIASCPGAMFASQAARVHPAKLARGVADAAERRGAQIYEQTRVTRVEPGRVHTAHGVVRAHRIVIGLAGYLSQLPYYRRDAIPAYNYMIATEPLSRETWDRIGLSTGTGFGDASRFIIYAHRTADDRIAIGGRGLRYFYGSSIDPRFEHNPDNERLLCQALHQVIPDLGDVEITHRWGGAFGISRDMMASVNLDPATGIAGAGGYVGDGVAASNLAARTLADLLLDRKSALVELPWVGHQSPRWEPEPLRWIGVRAGTAINASADATENRTGRQARLHDVALRLLGANLDY
jgi:glycine/D-amino acid oxidase-like deaminating enzyme